MNFQLTPVQEELKQLTLQFVQKEMLPWVNQDEQEERFRPEWIARLGELGLTGIALPEEYGGSALGYLETMVMLEQLAGGNLGYAISVAVTGLTQLILNQFGSPWQKEKWIPGLARGQKIGAFSLSEAQSGSDAANLKTTAQKKGEFYLVNGTKLWTTQGDLADQIILLARTGGAGSSGISALLVEKGTPGFRTGKREKKMGLHTSHTMELIFENAKIPASHLIGKEGDGFKIAMMALDSGRITIGACALGIAEQALAVALHHAQNREQFGQPIAEFQGVSFMLADMATQIAASRLLVQKAAWLKDQNQPHSLEAAMAKLYATDMAMKVTTDAVQILGGSGYTQEFPVERWMREAKVLQIVEGTNQIQRWVIGKKLTQQ
ncbi:MAG: acyl-CoA dehydrogenase family protein [Bdellovibrionia bacterium]